MWTEFGRRVRENGSGGTDHGTATPVFVFGGGVKGGIVHGRTDELGFHAVEHPHYVTDVHATILHLMGLDHEQLTYRYGGRDFRLTDVSGRVVDAIFA